MTTSTDNYTIISADTHAGGSHEQYREYLDPAWRDAFDEWRGEYKNPWKDLRNTDLRIRNWDDERRDADELADGVVGEVLFPNTVPPFWPAFVLFAGPPQPEDYERRRAGIHAHNRWLVDFCGRRPERRAGIGQIFLNDIDDAITDATWIKEHGLRGGVLLPTIAPDVKWVRPLYDPEYDRLWVVLQDLDIPVHLHGGTGSPDYGRHPAAPMIMIAEVPFYGNRNLVHMLLAGVFEKFPRLKFVITESGLAQFRPMMKHLDGILAGVRKGAIGELKYAEGTALPRSASEYFAQSVWVGASFPSRADLAAREMLQADRLMWGSDYPHDEGTAPFTREHLRQVMHDLPDADKRAILGGNAAKLYGFDLDALAPLATEYGPTVEELSRPLAELPPEPNSALLRNAGEPVLAVIDMTDDVILIDEPAPHVRRLTMNRPEKRNALNHALRGAILDALCAGDADPEVRVQIVRGAGSCFSAGYELGDGNVGVDPPYYTPGGDGHWPRHVTEGWMSIWDLAKPVIAQVHGYCLAGGSELATGCDLVYVAEDAQIGYPAVRFGVPDMHFHAWLCGMRAAMELMLTGDSISGVEAVQLGWANRAFPADALDEEVLARAERVAKVPPDIAQLNKRVVHRGMEVMGLRTAIRTGTELCALGTKQQTMFDFVREMRGGLTEALQRRDEPFGDYRTAEPHD